MNGEIHQVESLKDGHHDHAVAAPGEGTLKRNIGPVGIVGLGLSIVNGWVAMSSTIVIGLGQGGTPIILYGLIGTSLVNAFVISTIAELAAAYPTAGGQYVWSAILGGALEDGDDEEQIEERRRTSKWV